MSSTIRALRILLLGALAGPAGAQVLFHEDFENGLANWTATSLWHVDDAAQSCAAPLVPFPSGTKAAWFGSALTCDYAPAGPTNASALRLTTPVQLPPPGSHLVLRFRRHLDTEGCAGGYDTSGFSFSTDGGATWGQLFTFDCRANLLNQQVPGLPWQTTRVAIDAAAGQSVLVGFGISVDPPFDEGLGWWIDDVEIAVEPGTTSCRATTSACPCQNARINAAANENYGGCVNSRVGEALLYGDGVASVSNDQVALRVADMPPGAPALLVQGNDVGTGVFGDGRACLAGPRTRLWLHTSTDPVESYPGPLESGLAVRGVVPAAGGTLHYQVMYRDAAAYCTSATWNTSNAYRIAWTP